jgi:hypothetical protein
MDNMCSVCGAAVAVVVCVDTMATAVISARVQAWLRLGL